MTNDITVSNEREKAERFTLSPSPFAQAGGLWITQAGRYLLHPGNKRIFSGHHGSFWVANRQDGMMIKNGQTYVLGKNNVWCVPAHATVEYINNVDESLETFFIGFTGPQSEQIIRQSGMYEGYSEVSDQLFKQLLHSYSTILNTKQQSDTFKSELCRMESLYKVFNLLCHNEEDRTNYGEQKKEISWMEEALEYIHSHFHLGLTVTQVAEHVGIHRTHFSKQFHSIYKVPPAEYIRSLKLEKARHLLSGTNDSLAEIAYAVGYPDVFSFSKAFKKHCGFTPKKYRQEF